MRAAPGELEGVGDSSEGGSGCRESRCSERGEYRGDLQVKERKREGGKHISTLQRTVNLYHTHWTSHSMSAHLI